MRIHAKNTTLESKLKYCPKSNTFIEKRNYIDYFDSIFQFTDIRGNEFHLFKLPTRQTYFTWKPKDSEKYSIGKFTDKNGKNLNFANSQKRFFSMIKNSSNTNFEALNNQI